MQVEIARSQAGKDSGGNGKGAKDRMVYISPDAHRALATISIIGRGRRPRRSFWSRRERAKGSPLGSRDPKEDGALRKKKQASRFPAIS